jgi:hypothetical protein
MRIKTEKGTTEVRFKDFVAVEPKCEQVRSGYRQACIDKPADKDKHGDKVLAWANKNFGENRYIRDFDTAVGRAKDNEALKLWQDWLAARPIGHHKAYYNSEVVAKCIMGEDENA